MKRLVVALCIMCSYQLVDKILTVIGLSTGKLYEMNPFVIPFLVVGPILGLVLHFIVNSGSIILLSLVLYKMERRLGTKNLTYVTVTMITAFYVYVLIHNLYVIWRYV